MSRTLSRNCCHSTGNYLTLVLYVVVIIFTFLIENSAALKCYKCQVVQTTYVIRNQTVKSPPQCSKFDKSDEYIVDCPYSTMCVKKIFRFQLANGQPIDTVTRDCASQKYEDQVFRNGWHKEHHVEEPYAEGCETPTENDLSASKTTYCHCRGNLCNSATKKDPSNGLHTDAMAVIFVFNAMKYLNSGLAQY